MQPYLTLSWLAKSSTLLIGDAIRWVVKKATKLALYVELMIIDQNHQLPAVILAEVALQSESNGRLVLGQLGGGSLW